jgi:anti-sigma regulatory factor (Ser/Thr protein kinase)
VFEAFCSTKYPQLWKALWITGKPAGKGRSGSRLRVSRQVMETVANRGLPGGVGDRVVDNSVECVDFREGDCVKSFFAGDVGAPVRTPAALPHEEQQPMESDRDLPTELFGRIAVYDSLIAAPRVEDVTAPDSAGFIEDLAALVYRTAHEQGGRIPYTIIREIVENFIHARFTEVIVTIMDDGSTIRFSDQGPGIVDKEKAFLPGYSTASGAMKRVIRGVGSGLPIVKECLSFAEGSIDVEDNLGRGTVVTLRAQPARRAEPPVETPEEPVETGGCRPRLSVRQKQVLSLVMELGAVGPSAVSKELQVALSTAYRDLAFLEEAGLIATDGAGKRALTEDGVAFLDGMFN